MDDCLPRRRAQYTKPRDEYEEIFRALIRAGIKSGHFAKVDEKFAALIILSALNGTHQWYKPDGPWSAAEVGQQIADMLLNGLLQNK